MNILKKIQHLTLLVLAVLLVMALPVMVSAAEDTHTVTYVIDGEVVSTQEVAHGGNAAAPQIPDKIGYTQIAPYWDHDGKNITADTTITAVYTLNEYTITYKFLDGSTRVLTYLHGEQVVMLDPPVKEGYYFRWDKTVETLTENVTINAVYADPPQQDEEVNEDLDNDEIDDWMPIILIATAVLIVIFVLLYLQKKKLDKQAKG